MDGATGQLDSKTGHSIMELFRALMDPRDTTVLAATRDLHLIKPVDRTLVPQDGRLSPG